MSCQDDKPNSLLTQFLSIHWWLIFIHRWAKRETKCNSKRKLESIIVNFVRTYPVGTNASFITSVFMYF